MSRRTFSNMQETLRQCGIAITYNRKLKCYECDISDDVPDSDMDPVICDAIREFIVGTKPKVNSRLKNRVQEEPRPSKGKYYDLILRRIRDNEKITLVYSTYRNDGRQYNYTVCPLALKEYKRRWYLLAEHATTPDQNPELDYVPNGKVLLSLDRIVSVSELSPGTFHFPDFDAEKYFSDYFGVITFDRNGPLEPEEVLLKVYTKNMKHRYLADLPLHHSQEIFEKNDKSGYWLFRYRLAPTYDFVQELLAQREDVEVLEPLSLRRNVAEALYKTAEHYQTEITALKQPSDK